MKEIWTETSKGSTIERDRKIGKLFVRGDSVIIIVKNPGAQSAKSQKEEAGVTSMEDGGGGKRVKMQVE